MLTKYNLKMPHAVYGGENAMENITAIIRKTGAKRVALRSKWATCFEAALRSVT